MIEGFSITDPKWRLVVTHCAERISQHRVSLERAKDPVDIHRLQGAINELKLLIETPDVVSTDS